MQEYGTKMTKKSYSFDNKCAKTTPRKRVKVRDKQTCTYTCNPLNINTISTLTVQKPITICSRRNMLPRGRATCSGALAAKNLALSSYGGLAFVPVVFRAKGGAFQSDARRTRAKSKRASQSPLQIYFIFRRSQPKVAAGPPRTMRMQPGQTPR